jgi:hypothetical protein
MNDTENSLVVVLTGRSGQQHGVMALMSVFGSILVDSDEYSGLLAEHAIALGRKAVFPGVQGDTPAMAEMLNRCGHSSKQACTTCWMEGDSVCTKFEDTKVTATTYALKLDQMKAKKTEQELQMATRQYVPVNYHLPHVPRRRGKSRAANESSSAALLLQRGAQVRAPAATGTAKRVQRPTTSALPKLGTPSSLGAKKSKAASATKRSRAQAKESLLLQALHARINGQGPTPWLILPYVMLTMFGGIDDGMHTLVIGVLG